MKNSMKITKATSDDSQSIVKMLADDKLRSQRENFKTPLPNTYLKAFEKIKINNNQELIVMKTDKDEVVGTLLLSFIQYLTYQGGVRAQVEAVRIKKNHRGQGVGKMMLNWDIERAEAKGAHVIQLITDKKRPEALAFYEELGFKASHEGMKLYLG